MLNVRKQLDPCVWEIWVQFDENPSGFFGTLYVIGEIPVSGKQVKPLIRKKNYPGESLELMVSMETEGALVKSPFREVMYSEPIENLNRYSSVCIYSGNELLATFNDIEVFI